MKLLIQFLIQMCFPCHDAQKNYNFSYSPQKFIAFFMGILYTDFGDVNERYYI